MPGYHVGRPPRNEGRRCPADPPTVEEIIAVMRVVGERPPTLRMWGLIVVLWRAGLRIRDALALTEADLGHDRGSLLVRRGKGGRRREVGMDEWGWVQFRPWLEYRLELPVGPISQPPQLRAHRGRDQGAPARAVHARRAPMMPASAGLRLPV